MTERDDYLLDPAAAPEPEVQALERALLPFAWREMPRRADVSPRKPRRWRLAPWLLAAALLAVTAVQLWSPREEALREGALPRSFVAQQQELRIPLGDLAEITLLPGSELAFVHWRADQALFELRKGRLSARVEPPPKVAPRFFAMDTPVGRLVDEGCRYELDLQDGKRAHVWVTEGAVTFAAGERTVFVPAGATSIITATAASTPVFSDADAELRKAVREFDAVREQRADQEVRGRTLKQVLAASRRPRDSLVIWHVLRDPDPMFRKIAEQHLFDIAGNPDGGKTKRETFDPDEWLAFLRSGAWQGGG